MSRIRSAEVDDARALVGLLERLAVETDFMVVTVPDAKRDIEAVREYLKSTDSSPINKSFLAVDGDRVVGVLVASGESHPSKMGSIDVDVGVRKAWHRRGYGRELLLTAEKWARQQGAHRLQLRVMVHNAPAIALYKGVGFEIEGTLRRNLKINGQFIDQYVMAKLLD